MNRELWIIHKYAIFPFLAILCTMFQFLAQKKINKCILGCEIHSTIKHLLCLVEQRNHQEPPYNESCKPKRMQSGGLPRQKQWDKRRHWQMLMLLGPTKLWLHQQMIGVACIMYFHCRMILYTRNLCYSIILKGKDTYVCFSQNSTVSLTQLRCYGDMQSIISIFLAHLPNINSAISTGFQNALDGKFTTAKLLVPQCLNMCDTLTIRQFFRKTWQYMDAYRYVLNIHCNLCYWCHVISIAAKALTLARLLSQ